mgnify:CR=1 FL=1
MKSGGLVPDELILRLRRGRGEGNDGREQKGGGAHERLHRERGRHLSIHIVVGTRWPVGSTPSSHFGTKNESAR